MYEDCIINSELELINIIIDWSRPKFLPTEWFNWHGQEIIWWIKSTKSLTKNGPVCGPGSHLYSVSYYLLYYL